MTGNENVSDKTSKITEREGKFSKRYQFRVKIRDSYGIDDEITTTYNGNVTHFFKDVLKNRHMYAKHKQKRLNEFFDWLEESELTIGDIKDSPRWREFVEKTI